MWLVLVGDLRRRFILDAALTANIQDLTTNELVGLVKHLETGPATWSPGASGFVPELFKALIINSESQTDTAKPQLLPSGRHVLLSSSKQLECWEVQEDPLVWKHIPAVERAQVDSFAAEEADGALTILICEYAIDRDG